MVEIPPSTLDGNFNSAAFLLAIPIMDDFEVVVPFAITLLMKFPEALYLISRNTNIYSSGIVNFTNNRSYSYYRFVVEKIKAW
jgi:hypothetical protein